MNSPHPRQPFRAGLTDPYVILGLSYSAGETRSARPIASWCGKIIPTFDGAWRARGIPQAANDSWPAINNAYDKICAERGLP